MLFVFPFGRGVALEVLLFDHMAVAFVVDGDGRVLYARELEVAGRAHRRR
jgi:hypothetical protein